MPDQFFTATNILSVGAATAAVALVANTLYSIAGVSRKRSAFLTAIVLAYLPIFIEKTPQTYEWVLGFLNACLLYCSALGINEMAAASAAKGRGFIRGRAFISSWLRPPTSPA